MTSLLLSKAFDTLNHDCKLQNSICIIFNMTLENFFIVTFLSNGTEQHDTSTSQHVFYLMGGID